MNPRPICSEHRYTTEVLHAYDNDDRIFNFSAGPAVLPVEVLEEAQRICCRFPASACRFSRSAIARSRSTTSSQGCEADLRTLAGIPDSYHVLFLQGGASLQFSMVPMNLLPAGGSADYIVTGSWSQKAVKEAKRVGAVKIAASTESGNFTRVPRQNELTLDPKAAVRALHDQPLMFGAANWSDPIVLAAWTWPWWMLAGR